MKRSNGVIGATVLALLGSLTAVAESSVRFDVPFAFAGGKARMSAGSYELSRVVLLSSTPVYRLTNVETGRSVAVAAMHRTVPAGAHSAQPSIEFRCGGERCNLIAIYGGAIDGGAAFPATSKEQAAADSAFDLIRIPASD